MLLNVVAVVLGYLLGSVSFSYLFGKWLKGIDIRQHGSGNAGATNTMRVLGVGPAVAVLVLDALKGAAAVILAYQLAPGLIWVAILSGLAAVAGHNWPIFFGFKGGKGIATTIGVLASLSFLPVLFAGLIAIAVIALTRYVSLGSLLFTATIPVFLLLMSRPMELFWASLIIFMLAVYRHRGNIAKLLNGSENKIGVKKQS